MMDVLHLLHVGMRLYRDRVEAAHLPDDLEGRVERRERLHVGVGPRMLVAFEERQCR